MKNVLLASAALAALWVAPALAADPGMPMEEAPIGFSWTGAYVGAQIGYAWGDVDRATAVFANSYDADGFLGGVHAGYNLQLNSFVFGIEGDFEFTGIDGDDNAVGGTTDEVDVDWMASIRGRAGYAIDRILIYGTGGVAFADVGQRNTAGVPVSSSDTLTGWTAGGGVEYAFTDNLTTRLEYRFTDLGDQNYVIGGLTPFNQDYEFHTVRLGVSYKF